MPLEILLVEDSPQDAELAAIAIRRAAFGGVLTHLPDGERALEWLCRRDADSEGNELPLPGLVLLDLKLPRVDGLAVLRQVKSTPRLKRLPVVVFTSSREERDLACAFELGANAYVVKPVEFSAYCEAIAQILGFWTRISEEPTYSTFS